MWLIFILINVEMDLKTTDTSVPMQFYGQCSAECITSKILLLDTQTQILPSRSSQAGEGERVHHHVGLIPDEE